MGIDFLSQSVVKSNFRDRPEMVELKTSELAGLKWVEILGYPLRAAAYLPTND